MIDAEAFDRLVEEHRSALHAHCYRLLGSVHDADDALQETLLAAWRGLDGYEGRAPVHHWLHRIATHASLRLASRRTRRMLAHAYGPPRTATDDLGEPVPESVWIEPYPDAEVPYGAAGPEARYEQRESVELAFVAALQHLPPTQRAALLLKDVLGFPSAEVADMLGHTRAAVNSALQRARATLDKRLDAVSQQDALRFLGEPATQQLVDAFVDAWQRADIEAHLLTVRDGRIAAINGFVDRAVRESAPRFLVGDR